MKRHSVAISGLFHLRVGNIWHIQILCNTCGIHTHIHMYAIRTWPITCAEIGERDEHGANLKFMAINEETTESMVVCRVAVTQRGKNKRGMRLPPRQTYFLTHAHIEKRSVAGPLNGKFFGFFILFQRNFFFEISALLHLVSPMPPGNFPWNFPLAFQIGTRTPYSHERSVAALPW